MSLESWEDAYRTGQGLRWWPESALVAFLGATYDKHEKRYERWALEVGCGTGRNMWAMHEWGFNVCGCDASASAIKTADAYLQARLGVGTKVNFEQTELPILPYSLNSFDLVVDCQAVQHVMPHADQPRAWESIYNVLKPGGKFWFMYWTGGHAAAMKIYAQKYPELGWIDEVMVDKFLRQVGFQVEPVARYTRSYPQHNAIAEWAVGVAQKPEGGGA